jgi:hypothetical protein
MFTSKTLCQIILAVKGSEQRHDTASQRIDVENVTLSSITDFQSDCFFFFFFLHRNVFKKNNWKVAASVLIPTEIRVS